MRTPGHLALRLVDILLDSGTVVGLLLSYRSERDARIVGEALVRYITSSSGQRAMTLEFIRESSGRSYRMIFDIRMDADDLRIVVDAVAPEFIERLRTSLSRFTYYMVMVGYEAKDGPVILDADEGRILKSDVLVDGERIVGRPAAGVDWTALLQGENAGQ